MADAVLAIVRPTALGRCAAANIELKSPTSSAVALQPERAVSRYVRRDHRSTTVTHVSNPMIAKIKQLPQAQPGQAGRSLGSVEPVCRRRGLGDGVHASGKAGSPATTSFAARSATDAKTLAACLKFDVDFDRAGERLGTYAFLKTAEDTANSTYQRMHRPLSQRRPAAPARRPATSGPRSWPFRRPR